MNFQQLDRLINNLTIGRDKKDERNFTIPPCKFAHLHTFLWSLKSLSIRIKRRVCVSFGCGSNGWSRTDACDQGNQLEAITQSGSGKKQDLFPGKPAHFDCRKRKTTVSELIPGLDDFSPAQKLATHSLHQCGVLVF